MDQSRFIGPIVALAAATFAAAGPPQNPKPHLSLTLRVMNWANVPAKTLSQAERLAAGILEKAGVEVAWVDCNTPAVGAQTRSPCLHQGLGPAELWLRIVLSKQPGDSEEMLGRATPDFEPRSGFRSADVLYPMVQALAQRWSVDASSILGAAATHEIGHLLGLKAHSAAGIMCGQWDRRQVKLAGIGRLLFTHEQAEEIRIEITKRRENR